MRAADPDAEAGENLQTPSEKSAATETAAGTPEPQRRSGEASLAQLAARFPLPWSAYVRLLSLSSVSASATRTPWSGSMKS